MRKIFLITFVTLCLAIPSINFTSCEKAIDTVLNLSDEKTVNYLVCGIDDASQNTDVLFVLNYNTGTHRAVVFQIPRDTYFNYGTKQNKINQIYSHLLSKGSDTKDALNTLADAVGDALSIKIDGYFGINTDGFVNLVDAVGGVDVSLDEDYIYKNDNGEVIIELKKGVNHLSGKEAINLVRFRKGYKGQDVSRVDFTKIFLSSMLKKIKSEFNFKIVADILINSKEDIITNVKMYDILQIIMKNQGRISDITSLYVTMPGKAALSSGGVSYYVCNKRGTVKALLETGILTGAEFDRDAKFNSEEQDIISSIYNADPIEPKIYKDGELRVMPD
jgi:LCP family protein required for cell wall assembly